MKLGIESIKIALMAVFSFQKAYAAADADGKIDFADLPLLMDPALKAVRAAQVSGHVIPEFKDLDDEERAEITQYVKENFDLADDVLEGKIELAFEVLVKLSVFLK